MGCALAEDEEWQEILRLADTGKATAVRAHGLQLQPRWNGLGTPPVCVVPPFRGAPAFETAHPFHRKMAPGISLVLVATKTWVCCFACL